MGYGSYLIWANPDQPVYIDPRVELFPSAVWDEYIAINENRDAQTRLEKLGVTRVVLDVQFQPALALALAADPEYWRLAYTDARSQIFERK